jgi:hypothetical protein
MIDHAVEWHDDGSYWTTPWVKKSKIIDSEDTIAVRSLVVPNSKEPAAIIQIEYDGTGNGTVDASSDKVWLEDEEIAEEVTGVPIDENGYYRMKISEYSGYNSLYKIDTGIVH